MWWPRLEEKVEAIMSSGGSEKKSELRSDRELLEEVLSLSRLAAKRSSSQNARVSPGAMTHIVKTSELLLDEAIHYKDKDILSAVTELHEAAEHIIRAAT